MEKEENTNLVSTQQSLPQPSTVSPTIDVYGTKVNRSDFINYINENANSFFSTYDNMWSNKLKQLLLQLKDALINNIANGNITKIENNSIDITNIDNSGIDSTQGGAGLIIVGMADKVAKELHAQLEAAKPHKTWDNNTLELSWLNYFYGGKDPGDYTSWVNRDAKNDKGKRATTNRVAAIREWLNTINPEEYTNGLDAFGGQEGFSNRLNALKLALADGTIDNSDYTTADRLGFGTQLRTLLNDNIISLEDTDANANGLTSSETSTQPATDEEVIANAWQGGDPRQLYKLVADTIRGWKKSEYTTTISKPNFTDTNKYLIYRENHDTTGAFDRHNPASMLKYYSTQFFPAFFAKFKTPEFSPEYLNNHNYVVDSWHGKLNVWDYIAENLLLAIRNRKWKNGILLGAYAKELNPILNPDGTESGFWTIPGTFNEKLGTLYAYNPYNGLYKRISLADPKYKFNMLSYLKSKGIDLSQYQLLTQQDTSTNNTEYEKNGGKLEKLQYGGEIFDLYYSRPNVTTLGIPGVPTAQEIALKRKLQLLLAQQLELQKLQLLKDKFWKGNEGKEFHSASEFWNSLTPQDKREVYAAGLDLASIASNIGGAVSAAPTGGIGAIVGGVGSAATGLGAAALRTYNRAADGDFTLGDIGSSALDAGMALTGLIPGIGAAAKTGSIAAKFGKVAHIVMAGLGGLGLLESYPGAKRAAENILAGKMPSTSDLQSFTSAITMLSGHASYKGAKAASNRMLAHAALNGRIKTTSAKPESWTYKFNLKDANGALKPLKITLQTKLLVTTLKDAIKGNKAEDVLGVIKGADNRFKDAKVEDLSFTPMSKTEKLKSLKSDNVAGITHTKATLGGEEILAYDNPQNLELKMWNISLKGAAKANDLFPNINSIRSLLLGPSRKSIIENNMPHALESVHTLTEATLLASPVQELTSTQTPPTQEPIVLPEATPITNENGFVEVAHGPVETPTKPLKLIKLTTILPPTKDKEPNDPNFALLSPTESKILSLFLPGKDINKTNLIDFINKNKILYNKLSKKDKLFIDDLTSPNLFNEPAPEEVRKHLLDVVTKMITPKLGVTWRKLALDANTKALSMIRYGNGGIVKAQTGTNTFTFQPLVFGKVKGRTNYGGITNINNNTTWYNNVFTPYLLYIFDQLSLYGNNDTYGNWINGMLDNHEKLYQSAGGANGNFLNVAYNNNADAVRNYQLAYDADLYSKNAITHGYNTRGIALAYNSGRYANVGYAKRNGLDSLNTQWTPDGSYSGQTDDRRILGRKGDFTDLLLLDWNNKLKTIGWEQYLDPTTNYYKLRRLHPSSKVDGADPTTMLKSHVLTDVLSGLKNHIVDFSEAARVGWNNRFNTKLKDYLLEHMHPVLYLPYAFYRKIYGDYGTMSEYNRQGANTLNVANNIASNTADSSLAAATLLLGASQANDLAIKGKLADNLMIRDTYEKALALNKENLQIANNVANTNRKSLNDNDRERAQVVLATNTMNHLNWDKFWLAKDLKLLLKLDERDAMLKYLDYATVMNNNSRYYDPRVRDITNKYRQMYLDAGDDTAKLLVIASLMQDELNSLGYEKLDALLDSLAKLRGLKYSYTPTWRAKVTIPTTATPTYKAKGGTIDVTRLATTAVKEKNKDIERMYKDWSKRDDRFFNLLGKLRQARFDKIIKIK